MSEQSQEKINCERRGLLIATGAVSAVGVAGVAIPFISSFSPSEKAKAAGAAVEMDISGMQEGELRTVEWRGKPVWVIKRTPEMLSGLKYTDDKVADPKSERKPSDLTPEYCRNQHRSIKEEYLVAVGICSHLGCSPNAKLQSGPQASLPDDWKGGFLCPCHGSTFDVAGRVFKNKPAPDNLEIPPHTYLSDTKILIGEDHKA